MIPAAAPISTPCAAITPGIPPPAACSRRPFLSFSSFFFSFLTSELALLIFLVLALFSLFPSPLLRFGIKTFTLNMVSTNAPSTPNALHFSLFGGGFSVCIRSRDPMLERAPVGSRKLLKQPGSVSFDLLVNLGLFQTQLLKLVAVLQQLHFHATFGFVFEDFLVGLSVHGRLHLVIALVFDFGLVVDKRHILLHVTIRA